MKGAIYIRSETVTYKYTCDTVDKTPFGTFASFINARSKRGSDEARATGERIKWGKCFICQSKFNDADNIHMVFGAFKNSTPLGNKLCCDVCAVEHGNFERKQS